MEERFETESGLKFLYQSKKQDSNDKDSKTIIKELMMKGERLQAMMDDPEHKLSEYETYCPYVQF